ASTTSSSDGSGSNPRPPQPVTALSADVSQPREVVLRWTLPTGTTIQGVVVRRNEGSACPTTTNAGTPIGPTTARTSQIDTTVFAGATYCYAVFALNGDARASTPVTVTARTPPPPQPVTGLSADTSRPGEVSLSWSLQTGVRVRGVVVRRGNGTACPSSTVAGTPIGPNSVRSSQLDTAVIAGSTYCYAVFTLNAWWQISSPATVTVTVPAASGGGASTGG